VHGVNPAPVQQAHECAPHVASRDHVVGFHLCSVLQPHTGGLPVPFQHFDHPRAVPDCSPKAGETRLDGSGELKRAANGIPTGSPAHQGERHDDGEERPGGAVVRVPDAIPEQRILKRAEKDSIVSERRSPKSFMNGIKPSIILKPSRNPISSAGLPTGMLKSANRGRTCRTPQSA